MIKFAQKNKKFRYIISLLYLSFHLVSPFFHYHHEDSILDEGEVDYHSHLLQNVVQKTNTTECYHTVDQNDEHNHPVVLNALVTNLTPRFVDTLSSTLIICNIISFKLKTEFCKAKFTEDFHFGKILKDKCVHLSSNVSPPFAVTA
jgi:hypothetical protein